jgi:hypothetical protein
MFFIIEKSGCCEHKGLVQVRADFYREEGDKDYALTDCKIVPEKGYEGKVDENGIPIDEEDYKKWWASLPTEKKNLPFNSHFIYFEPSVTDEEILFCFELVKGWRENNLSNKNVKPVWRPSMKSLSESRVSSVKAQDFTKVSELYSVK